LKEKNETHSKFARGEKLIVKNLDVLDEKSLKYNLLFSQKKQV
jgi:hypothetical protein